MLVACSRRSQRAHKVGERRGALRIGKALGMTPDYWLNLQRMYDLDLARTKADTDAIEPLVRINV